MVSLESEQRALAGADAPLGEPAPTEPGADPVERLLADLNPPLTAHATSVERIF